MPWLHLFNVLRVLPLNPTRYPPDPPQKPTFWGRVMTFGPKSISRHPNDILQITKCVKYAEESLENIWKQFNGFSDLKN